MLTGGSLATCLGRAKKLLYPVRLTFFTRILYLGRPVAEALQGKPSAPLFVTAVISFQVHHVLEADDCPPPAAGGVSCR